VLRTGFLFGILCESGYGYKYQSIFCPNFGSNWKSLGSHRLQHGDLLEKFNNLVPIGNHLGRQLLELPVCQENREFRRTSLLSAPLRA